MTTAATTAPRSSPANSCGCFYCGAIYPPSEIKDWWDPPGETGKTAVCAKCGIDSVIGDLSGFPITPKFLERMNRYWF